MSLPAPDQLKSLIERIESGAGQPSTHEKGGLPEDSRQKVNTMEDVADAVKEVKTPRIIPSLESPEAKAGKWLDQQIEKSKRIGVITQIVEVGPALARAMLNRNPDNRNLSEATVSAYARDIANDAWKFNGEPIIISIDGKLNDGQHRCEAVVRADGEIQALIVFGVDRSTRLTLDQGKVRTVGDYLGMDGITCPNNIAAMAAYVLNYKTYGRIRAGGRTRPTKGEILDFAVEHPALNHSLNIVSRKGSQALGGRSMLAAMHWIISEKSERGAVDNFFVALIEGANLKHKDPILYVRNRLINEGPRLEMSARSELIVKAWNAHREGNSIHRFEIAGGDLPKIVR